MTKDRRICIRAAIDEAAKHGATISYSDGTNHPIINVIFNNKQRKIALSSTPRSDNQIHWIKQDVRKLINSMR